MRRVGRTDGRTGRSKVMINAPIWQYKSFNPVARLITARVATATGVRRVFGAQAVLSSTMFVACKIPWSSLM